MFWEYRSINASAEGFFGLKFDLEGFTTRFNELGAQGWELVSVFDTNLGSVFKMGCGRARGTAQGRQGMRRWQ